MLKRHYQTVTSNFFKRISSNQNCQYFVGDLVKNTAGSLRDKFFWFGEFFDLTTGCSATIGILAGKILNRFLRMIS